MGRQHGTGQCPWAQTSFLSPGLLCPPARSSQPAGRGLPCVPDLWVLTVTLSCALTWSCRDVVSRLSQEIERLQQAASELRAQLDCYQTPDWALQSFGEDTGRQALLPCASPRLRPLALISSPIITGATIDTRRTSPIYELRSWFSRHCFWCSVNPPDTILQVWWRQSAVPLATFTAPSAVSPQPRHIAQAVKPKVRRGVERAGSG